MLLDSDVFYKYIRQSSKDYLSGYISMSKNYLKNFGVIGLSDEEKEELQRSKNPNKFWLDLYKVNGSVDL